MRRFCFVLIAILFGLVFFSCQSTKGKQNSFLGIVIDENNMPVNGFEITIENKDGFTETCFTENNGTFVFYNLRFGDYRISGKKIGYSMIENENYSFYKTGDFCICQVFSGEEVLNTFYDKKDSASIEELENLLSCVYLGEKKDEK